MNEGDAEFPSLQSAKLNKKATDRIKNGRETGTEERKCGGWSSVVASNRRTDRTEEKSTSLRVVPVAENKKPGCTGQTVEEEAKGTAAVKEQKSRRATGKFDNWRTEPKVSNVTSITNQDIKDIIKNSNDDAVIQFIAKDDFLKLIDSRISMETMCLVITVLSRATNISAVGNIRTVLNKFLIDILPLSDNSNFLTVRLPIFIVNLAQSFSSGGKSNKFSKTIGDLLVFLQRLHSILPAASVDVVRDTINQIEAQIIFINKRDNCISDSILELLNEINASVEKAIEAKAEPFAELCAAKELPPNDFREIGICPTEADIFTMQDVYLRKNIVKGTYEDTDHYLDVQFRLLHEDFIRGLREGIREYTALIKTIPKHNIRKAKDVNVYNNVRIEKSNCQGSELVYKVSFDVSKLQYIQWQVKFLSKMFLVEHNSLVILSRVCQTKSEPFLDKTSNLTIN